MGAELRWTSRPPGATAVVLVLHGGRVASERKTTWHDVAVVRMVPVARAVAAAGRGSFAVARLRYAVRGWNGDAASPLMDARAALDEISERFPGLPIAVVGHSMGGRVAMALADDPRVVEVVGLAPWVEHHDDVKPHDGVRILLIHGLGDRVTSPAASRRVVEALQSEGRPASFVGLKSESHAMLWRAKAWDLVTGGYLRASLDSERAGMASVDGLAGIGARAFAEPIIAVI